MMVFLFTVSGFRKIAVKGTILLYIGLTVLHNDATCHIGEHTCKLPISGKRQISK
jgi:hypothetical protein